jgi:hydrogenase-4 component F
MPPALLWTGFLLILIGFGTKAGLVPMHTWLPDAHSQAPASICALLSGVETTTVLYAILRLFPALEVAGLAQARNWFVVFGLISVGVAALLLIHVRDYKRMFAFSTVEHMGIILVAVGLGGGAAHLGAAYQITAHALAKSFCFYAAGIAVLAVGTQEIAAVRGLLQSSPGTALTLLLGGLAIAGAPPFAVFVSEFAIFKAGLAAGQYWTIGLLAFFVVVAFCAILLQLSRMIFGPPEPSVMTTAAPAACRATLLLAAIPMTVLGLYVPAAFQSLLRAAAATLGG